MKLSRFSTPSFGNPTAIDASMLRNLRCFYSEKRAALTKPGSAISCRLVLDDIEASKPNSIFHLADPVPCWNPQSVKRPYSLLRNTFEETTTRQEKQALAITTLTNIIERCNLIFEDRAQGLPFVAMKHLMEELKTTLESLFQPGSQGEGLQRIIESGVYSSDFFRDPRCCNYFVRSLVRCCHTHHAFKHWAEFGDPFQTFLLQVLNEVSRVEAKIFCSGLIDQIDPPLKETAYNAILECFGAHSVPPATLSLGTTLLQEMHELGFLPTCQAYRNVVEFNLIRFYRTRLVWFLENIKSIYTLHKGNMVQFDFPTYHRILDAYAISSQKQSQDDIAFLEVVKGMIDNGASPSSANCKAAIDACERLLCLKDNAQGFATKDVSARIHNILISSNGINGIPSGSVFCVMLNCYVNLVLGSEEMHLDFMYRVFQSLGESDFELEKTHFEAILVFYGSIKCFSYMEKVLQSMGEQGILIDAQTHYLALDCYILNDRMTEALSHYERLTGQQAFSNPMLNQEIFSLLMIPAAANENLPLVVEFWNACWTVGNVTSFRCYLNALNAFDILIWTIRFKPKPIKDDLYASAYALLQAIIDAIDSNHIAGATTHVYDRLIKNHANLYILSTVVDFEGLQRTYSKYLFSHKRSSASYYSIFKAFWLYLDRDPNSRELILTETRQLAIVITKLKVQLSCNTHEAIFKLLVKLGDDQLFASFGKTFQSKKDQPNQS
ncbi:hypothetical protein DSO57_1009435 [Entomophthora muscae]|nr:hypothetical protein DSO57_1009435 [Entomophthora muscae]